MVVIGCERGHNAVAVEELTGHPRILAGDQIGARKGRERAQGDVAEIADRSSNNMQPRRNFAGFNGMAADDIAPERRTPWPRRDAMGIAHCRYPSADRSAVMQVTNSLSFPFG